MIHKKSIIIIFAVAIIVAFVIFSSTKADVTLDVHAEDIPNSSDIYLVSELHDSSGNLIDTPFGKLSITFWDEYEIGGAGYEGVSIEHGQNIMRHSEKTPYVMVYYDGGYFYNPCEYSGKLIVKNSTGLSDDNLKSSY